MAAGRPTELTEELTLKIRKGVLEGKKYNEIQTELGISDNTWDTWVYKDYQGFRTKLDDWKYERMLKLSEKNIGNIMQMETAQPVKVGEEWQYKQDAALVGQVAKVSMFVAERLNKKKYAARTELTGKDGEALPTPIYSGKAE